MIQKSSDSKKEWMINRKQGDDSLASKEESYRLGGGSSFPIFYYLCQKRTDEIQRSHVF